MIECAECGTPQFVQITQSRMHFGDWNEVTEASERYECTFCGATGKYTYDKENGVERVSGDMENSEGRPRTSP